MMKRYYRLNVTDGSITTGQVWIFHRFPIRIMKQKVIITITISQGFQFGLDAMNIPRKSKSGDTLVPFKVHVLILAVD